MSLMNDGEIPLEVTKPAHVLQVDASISYPLWTQIDSDWQKLDIRLRSV
jgi:hypothetical protein